MGRRTANDDAVDVGTRRMVVPERPLLNPELTTQNKKAFVYTVQNALSDSTVTIISAEGLPGDAHS